jgi:hypothetical protein
MQKRVKVAFWLIVLLLLLAAVSTYLRFEVSECQYGQGNQNSEDVALKCIVGAWSTIHHLLFEDWDSERTISLFTVMLFGATYALWRSTRDLVRGAERTAERQLRAYATVETINATEITVAGRVMWHFQPIWKNGGRTPARRLFVACNCEVLEGDLPDDFNFPVTNTQGPTILGPQLTMFGGGARISKADLDRVAVRHRRAFVWGWAEYSDMFNLSLRHRTEFCWELTIEITGSKIGIGMGQHPKYNNIDDDCSGKPSTI